MTHPKANIFNPLSVIIALLCIIVAFAGYGLTSDRLNTDLNNRLILQNNELARIAVEQNDRMIDIQNAQGNLSAESRQKIMNSIIKNEQQVIPELLNMTKEAHEFWQFLRTNFDETYLENEYRQYAQSNNTMLNIQKILDNQERILAKFNQTTQ